MADLITGNQEAILAANRLDLQSDDLSPSSRDRLLLNPKRIAEMLAGVPTACAYGRCECRSGLWA
jgi:gamma-glutamyl phosphate reductase